MAIKTRVITTIKLQFSEVDYIISINEKSVY